MDKKKKLCSALVLLSLQAGAVFAVEPGTYRYTYQGVNYATKAAAEAAMRGDSTRPSLARAHPVGKPQWTGTGPITQSYAVEDIQVIPADSGGGAIYWPSRLNTETCKTYSSAGVACGGVSDALEHRKNWLYANNGACRVEYASTGGWTTGSPVIVTVDGSNWRGAQRWQPFKGDVYTYEDGTPESACILNAYLSNTETLSVFEVTPYGICPTGYTHKNLGTAPFNIWCDANTNIATITMDAKQYPAMCAGNPCTVDGIKIQSETDYASPTLTLVRTYQSTGQHSARPEMGHGWIHNYARYLMMDYSGNPMIAVRANGSFVRVLANGTNKWKAVSGPPLAIEKIGTEFRLDDGSGSLDWYVTETADGPNKYGRLVRIEGPDGRATTLQYDTKVRLTSVTDPDGRSLTFAYTNYVTQTLTFSFAAGSETFTDSGQALTSGAASSSYQRNTQRYDPLRIASVTDPDGGVIEYTYAAGSGTDFNRSQLTQVEYPDTKTRTYHYENSSFPQHLTGITDEKGNRFSTYAYDAKGRVTSSQHAGGAGATTLTYQNDSTTTITDANGHSTTYTLTAVQTVPKVSAITGVPCATCQGDATAYVYDTNGYLTQKTDFNGNITKYVRDTAGKETSRTEAFGTALARTITTTWHTSLLRPLTITEPGRQTIFTYDTAGRLATRSVKDTTTLEQRTVTYAYDTSGRLDTIDGPRTDVTDVTSFDYDSQGRLSTITNALSQATQVTNHDDHGNPTRILDVNGTEILLTYDARQRLQTRSVGGATTTLTYDDAGLLTQVELPDSSTLNYGYDNAHRLISIEDALGNHIEYTLNAAGQRTAEEAYDPSDVLKRSRGQVYDTLGRLQEIVGANSQSTELAYDDEGNLVASTQAGTYSTLSEYDALGRLSEVSDPATGQTLYAYNARDHLTGVTDPRGMVTTYTRNAFG